MMDEGHRINEIASSLEGRDPRDARPFWPNCDIKFLLDQIDALREQIARLTAPASGSEREWAEALALEMQSACGIYHTTAAGKITRALARARRQGREQMREEALAAVHDAALNSDLQR